MFGFGSRPQVKSLSPTEAGDLAGKGAVQLVDVREDGEWAQARIKGAIHVPLSRLPQLIGTIPADKPVVFYCLSGARSAQAIGFCARQGLPHDTHMAGGLSAWHAHGLPLAR